MQFMVMELAKKGPLDKMIAARGPALPRRARLDICEQVDPTCPSGRTQCHVQCHEQLCTFCPGPHPALQICSAMSELARAGIVHRDLAARNVLVMSSDPWDVKVGAWEKQRHVLQDKLAA